ncbi:MBL fold metallo-hydrolase [Sphingomonas sabuli]|uniref:MBL fold metallo-hydrolase n=1 Tax=Sphingomonas sabuli TaxID=2764186 RepID=A0A7G9L3J8_9SPHN|nr:MBL fold metallo-hydrolase [Sphingomonas sabuli]QNM83197.1 MBL fold metallo-hydrolase [Sphingomonas sabuli]
MKLRILGCGTSTGVPRVGPDWGQCDPEEPRNRRMRCAILVSSGEERLLVDCGPDIRNQLLDARVDALDHVVITHDHADHCHGIDDLRPIAQRKGAIPLHARPTVLEQLQARFAYAFATERLYPALVEAVPVGETLTFGRAELRFVDQPHGSITALGLRFDESGRSAVYAIDYNEMTDDMAALYEGADVLISDCLQRRPHPTHAHLDAVIGWARELRVGQLYLSHMNTSMDYVTLRSELPDWAAPAHDGLEITV